jgi:hypothetical protein
MSIIKSVIKSVIDKILILLYYIKLSNLYKRIEYTLIFIRLAIKLGYTVMKLTFKRYDNKLGFNLRCSKLLLVVIIMFIYALVS